MRFLVTSVAALTAVILTASSVLSQGTKGADLAKARQVYNIFCVTCHGPKGDGKGPVGVTLQPPPRDFTVGEFKYGSTDEELFKTITNGGGSKGGSPLMAPWGAVIPEADRWALVAFIRTFKKP